MKVSLRLCIASSLGLVMLSSVGATFAKEASTKKNACANDNAGLKLSPGFCASIFADNIGHARHMAISKEGVLYVNTWSGRYFGNDKPHEGGFLVALQDKSGKGKADVIERFGETVQSGGAGGTGIALYNGYVYAENNDKILRYKLQKGSIVPKGQPEVVLSGLPLTGDHPMHPFAIDANGKLYVDLGSATNSCQEKNRTLKSPGVRPCVEKETRGGIWRYDAKKLDQKFSPAERYATGIRNAVGIAIDSSGRGVYATQHGRDQLSENWPDLYKPEQGPILPAEELLRVEEGGDYGWPQCYYDGQQKKLVLAPEYGGNGGKLVGECAAKLAPIASFPAHWAPNALQLYYGKQFPARYREGAFIAFHGSWNRAPYPQQGFNVVFQPLRKGAASGDCEIFADGFAGTSTERGRAAQRPSGLAVAPDGSLFIADDNHGRIYRVTYRGGADAAAKPTKCPGPDASPGEPTRSTPPAATRSSTTNTSALPSGITAEMVESGNQLYHAAICSGCHGSDAAGNQIGPNLTDDKWLWSDGSVAGIAKTITDGVAQPKEYRSMMPPMGGARWSSEQVNAVAAYLWSLSHAGK